MSDLFASLVLRARGEPSALRPVSRVYSGPDDADEPDDRFEVVEEEDEEAGEMRPAPAPSPRAREVRPETAPAEAPTVTPAPPEGIRAKVEPSRLPTSAAEPEVAAGQQPAVQPEEAAAPAASHPVDQPAPRRRGRRSPRVEPPLAEAAVPARPVIVERRLEPSARPDHEHDEAPPVQPAEPLQRAGRPPLAARRTAVEPDLPAPQIREQVILAPEAAPEPPVIHVSIGRVELRAPTPAPAPRPVELARPKQSLDDYLLARDRGRA